MRKTTLVAGLLAGIASTWLCAAPAAAVVPICSAAPCPVAFVSANGYTIASNGANACISGSPVGCALISEALSSVNAGGTIVILDGQTYLQSVTINKSVTIISAFNPVITPPSGSPAFLVNTAGTVFELDRIVLDGGSGGTFGVSVTNAADVRLKNTLVKNFTGAGVVGAIDIKPASGVTTKVTIVQANLHNNSFGIVADDTGGGIIRGVVSDSVISGNVNNAITASSSGANIVLLVDQTTVTGNGFGLVASGTNAGMLVRNSSIVANNTGLFTSGGGVLFSYGNNSVNGNTTTDGTFTGTIGQQ